MRVTRMPSVALHSSWPATPPLCTARTSAVGAGRAAAATSTSVRRIDGLREVIGDYNGVLLDQFGVLHDGRTPYPGAIDAVSQLAAAGKTLLVLSNSSRRSGGTLSKLAKMGFDEAAFAGAITSGEIAHCCLATRPSPFDRLGHRCIHITWNSRGTIHLAQQGLTDLQIVMDPAQADFVLAHGTEAIAQPDGSLLDMTLEQLEELLQRCAAQGNLPLIVANPDIVTVDGGALVTMPGTLARIYAAAGGHVHLMGKPAPIIYAAAKELAPGVQRWLAIGDSLEHDCAGAASAGIDSLLIVGGIHAEDAGLQGSSTQGNASCKWEARELEALCKAHSMEPSYFMAYMHW